MELELAVVDVELELADPMVRAVEAAPKPIVSEEHYPMQGKSVALLVLLEVVLRKERAGQMIFDHHL